jgi:hypothetical protein
MCEKKTQILVAYVCLPFASLSLSFLSLFLSLRSTKRMLTFFFWQERKSWLIIRLFYSINISFTIIRDKVFVYFINDLKDETSILFFFDQGLVFVQFPRYHRS